MVATYLISAEVYASLFALMAMGLTLTYMTTKVPNFAYGDMVVLGVYSSYATVKVYHSSPYVGSILGFVVAGLVSVAMYLTILRPLARRGASIVSLMIATFGADIGFAGIFGIYTDYLTNAYSFPDAKEFYTLGPDFSLGGYPGIDVAAPVAVAATVLVIYLLLTRTKFGVTMRASIENPPLARILGINVDLVYTASWFLAGGLAGFAGAFLTLDLPLLSVNTGNDLIIGIFAASVLGGLTSIFGSAVGGLIIGGSEILMTIWLGAGFGYGGTVFICVILILLGASLLRKKSLRPMIGGGILLALGVWVIADATAGLPIDFVAPEFVNGLGSAIVNPFQVGIPLIIMAFALLIVPQGIFSVDFRRLLRPEKK
ncbi:MAG: branched-chain amino acid ABC transporter permease [Nitrososphaerota archaeon]|nr:branched-chain amino acid ABC transporter permease [Nitrososphaerota archaeon]MDG7024199.1 branched-chain amino acid ABC transporter permease [Nitrososphaerota archaeon]